jgi:uncharacterized membrane protein
MATLTVLKFPNDAGADTMLGKLAELQKQQLITVLDAATVVWPEGKKKPKTRQMHNLAAAGALSGTFWGMLFGLIFLMPLFGAAIGALTGALTGSFADIGIDDNFIKDVREKVTPGTSALFLLSANAVVDRIAAEVKDLEFELIASNLSAEQEAKLKEVFGSDDEA